ncbi:lytic polysaccharide monooxygenase [Actinomadura sp. NAK00032]|uniref:lytic polysaccharide monooxygenase auxiliary activity family 9 protein n=1 Tax=Actinomadura sp. NAK00032 TaxID=2742128 RepID=UPI00158FBAF4|nr:lytic polysaccharide monooxygenase [Actinomadura sp. NAK00032]QKW35941.1 lytic polysaccharide monooxygenase [Actinomadura sp. NAK00032]
MGKRRRRALAAGAVLGPAMLAGALITAVPASAHGAMMVPGSRTYLCWKDGLTSTGQIVPHNPACAAAIAQSGSTSLYNWFAVLRSDGAGRTRGFIPDGELCSGGAVVYDFSGYDLARDDWPVTHLTSGADIEFRYNKWAAHPGTFRTYITKDTWSPTRPLSWDDLEDQPFYSATDPPSVGSPGSEDAYYHWNARLPSGKSGRHIIYTVWQRSDSNETFYGCSDVVFDGGSGEVTGVGEGDGDPTDPPTDPTDPPGTPGMVCTAEYRSTNSWGGGYQGEVKVTNTGTLPLNGWMAHFTFANGETVGSLWNGTYTQSGPDVTVKNAGWNGSLAVGASTTFGFTANAPGSATDLEPHCMTS